MNDTDLHTPQLYINRELSFLEFNHRVQSLLRHLRLAAGNFVENNL